MHGYESRAQRHFGFAEAHVAADDSIHRPLAREVRQHVLDGCLLVLRFFEGEVLREPGVAVVGERELRSDAGCALRVDIEKLGGNVTRLRGGFAFGFRPLIRAELVQRRLLG